MGQNQATRLEITSKLGCEAANCVKARLRLKIASELGYKVVNWVKTELKGQNWAKTRLWGWE